VSLRTAAVAIGLAPALVGTPPAWGHAAPLPPETKRSPIPRHDLIPPSDRASYHSRVIAIAPPVQGLRARVLGNQELLEVVWEGKRPLVVLGTHGEPVFRLGPAAVEANITSPTTWSFAERFGRLPAPGYARVGVPPFWRTLANPGPWRWYEHRAQWMKRDRPIAVGDGARRRKIFDWAVPVRVDGRLARIRGTLEWLPNPKALRDERSEVSSPLVSLAILFAAMGLGALAGTYLRDRELTGSNA
jgi:hypothetical protein